MIVFPNAKINLGLNVIEKRSDGFHNIETVFYPVDWCDALEVIENKSSKSEYNFSTSGIKIEGTQESNIIYKCLKKIRERKKIPSLNVHLHKNIPMGGGLGGGSSDAAFFLKLVNEKFNLNLPYEEKKEILSGLGSDCVFFLNNKPSFAIKRGEEMNEINLDLSEYYILIVFPQIHSNTQLAFRKITPDKNSKSPLEIIQKYKIGDWKSHLKNDFEKNIFQNYPEIQKLKSKLYDSGALFASLSGSGSSVFGIFKNEPLINFPKTYFFHLQNPGPKKFK